MDGNIVEIQESDLREAESGDELEENEEHEAGRSQSDSDMAARH
jgi:hypothetical protein